jgi:hypothetical protein
MLTVTLTPLTTTYMEVSVIYDGSDGSNPPVFVAVNEFDKNGNQLGTSGTGSPIDGFYYVFHNLQPATTYFYQLCQQFDSADGSGLLSECGAGNEFSRQTLPSIPKPPPSQQPEIWITAIQVFPPLLVKRGNTYASQLGYFSLSWESNVDLIGINVEVTSGNATHGENIGGRSIRFERHFEPPISCNIWCQQ